MFVRQTRATAVASARSGTFPPVLSGASRAFDVLVAALIFATLL